MIDWLQIEERKDLPPSRTTVLVTTAESEPLLSSYNRLPSKPLALAFRDGGRWWVAAGHPGTFSERLWFDPDIFAMVSPPK